MAERSVQHRKPADLESELAYFEELLGPVESLQLTRLVESKEPILYIMGCARSGTTLALQYLAHSGVFAYPTNFLSRFYYAPYIGARLQRLLVKCDFRNEIIPAADPRSTFKSTLGKTTGALAPHEFWYFWRRFFKFGDVQCLSAEELARVDRRLFLRELKALQGIEDLPFVLKGMILNWHIPFLASLDPNSYFLYIRRDPTSNAQSLLRARVDFFGSKSEWYSFKPPGYQKTLALSPEIQTSWQVQATNQAIEEGLSHVPSNRVFQISLEDFCGDPRQLVNVICERLNLSTRNADKLPNRFDMKRVNCDYLWKQAASTAKELSNA